MESEFDKTYLKAKLKELSREQKILFMLSCCERLYPNYLVFNKKHEWGNPLVLRKALDFAWTVLERGIEENKEELKKFIKLCDEITPDTEDFDSIFVSQALDSSVAVASLLEYIISDSNDKIIEVASLARDTVDMYVQELEDMAPNDPNLEKMILEHPLMQQELKRQRQDIEMLKNLVVSDVFMYEKVKKNWYRTKTSNIELT